MYAPNLKYSRWTLWEERNSLRNIDFPGIYMIAITRKRLRGRKSSYREVKYIGMTNAKNGIYGRLSQFNQSIHGRPGHSGGWTVYYDLGNYKRWKRKYKLYVCTMPIRRKIEVDKKLRKPDDIKAMGLIAYLEYAALAEYKKKTGTEPKYNTK